MTRGFLNTVLIISLGFLAIGCVTIPNPMEKKTYYSHKPVVMFILDTSDSMNLAASGMPKIDTAKKAIANTVSQIDKTRFNTSLITFESWVPCTASLSIEPDNNEPGVVLDKIQKVRADGKTPLAESIALSGEILKQVDKKIVILFSDGMETCGGNPVAAARALDRDYGIKINMQVIGYAVDKVTERQLKEIAKINKRWGYHEANDANELTKVINDIAKQEDLLDHIWLDVKTATFEFDTGMAVLKERYEENITKIYEYLRANEDRIRIIGHTDSVGAESYNQALSIKRAQAVKEALVEKGIKSSRIDVEGKGEQMPIAPNDTKEGRQSNRRVEIRVL